jgi:hypothetical protein
MPRVQTPVVGFGADPHSGRDGHGNDRGRWSRDDGGEPSVQEDIDQAETVGAAWVGWGDRDDSTAYRHVSRRSARRGA